MVLSQSSDPIDEFTQRIRTLYDAYLEKPDDSRQVVSRLFDEFSTVLEELQVANEELRIGRDELETRVKERTAELADLARFPGENPYPVMRLDLSGKILYANPSSQVLLEDWGRKTGELAPQFWREQVALAAQRGEKLSLDVAAGKQWFAVVLGPIKGADYVNLYGREITERKRVEEERERLLAENRRQSALLDAIFEADPGGLAVLVGPRLRFAYVNPAYRFIIPHPESDPVGSPYAQVWPDEQGVTFRIPIAGVLATGRPFLRNGIQRRLADGSRRYFTLQARRIEWEGQPAVLVIMWDTTDLKKAELAMRESEQQEKARRAELEAIMDAVPAIVWIAHDPACQHVSGNRAAHEFFQVDSADQVFGQDREQEIPRKFRILVNGVEPAPEERPLQVCAATGKAVHNFVEEILFEDGSRFHLLGNVTPLLDEHGRPAGAVGALVDITERKQAEQRIAVEKERFRTTLASIGDAVITTDVEGLVTFLNPVAEAMTGWNSAEAVGQPLEVVFPIMNEQTHQPIENPVGRVLREGIVVGLGNHTVLLDRDGRMHPIEDSAAPIRNEGGQTLGVVMVFHDITEKHKAQKELHQLNRTLQALGESSHAMLRAVDETSYLEAVCRIITEDCGHAMVWVGYAEDEPAKTVRPVANAGFEAGYLETLAITWAETERGQGPTGTAIRTGQVSTCRNMLTDPKFEPWRAEAIKRGYASSIVLPLLADGKVFGAISIYSRDPDPFSDEEVQLLSELANDLAYGIVVLRQREARAQAEEALRESEERYRLVLQNMPVFVANLDRDLRYTWTYNPKAGYHSEDLEGKTVGVSTDPETTGRVLRSLRDVVEHGASAYWEAPVQTSTGEMVLETHAEPRRDAAGNITGVSLVSIDITAHKQAERQIAAEKEWFRRTIASIGDAVITTDRDARVTYLNPVAEQLTGWSTAEAAGQPLGMVFRLVSELTRHPAENPVAIVLETGTVVNMANHTALIARDGRTIPIEDSAAPIKDLHGDLLGAVMVFHDVTAKRVAERTLRESEERARAQAAELETMMDIAPAFVWVSRDPQCKEMLSNQYGYDFLNMAPGANVSLSAPQRELPRNHRVLRDGQEIPAGQMPMQIAARTGQPQQNAQFDVVFDDGRIVHLFGNAAPLFDDDGKPCGAVGVFIDITEIRRAELETRQLAMENEIKHRLIEQREQERQQIARDLHDGPVQELTGVNFALQGMDLEGCDSDIQAQILAIQATVQGQISELRAFASGLRPPTLAKFGLGKAIRSHLETYREKYPQVEITFDEGQEGELLPEEMRLALYRIYQESLNNIAKHSLSTQVKVCFEKTMEEAVLEIQDNGAGFEVPQDWLALARQGHLGLVGIQERAEAIGGKAEIVSSPGNGTRIKITVPLQPAEGSG